MVGSKLSLRRAVRWLALWVLAITPLAHAGVTGRLTDAATGQPFPPELMPWVQLHSCQAPGDELCSVFAVAVDVAADGSYRFTNKDVPPGTYQVWGWADGHELGRTAPFTVTGSEPHAVSLALQILPVKLTAIDGCTVLEPGGYCTVSYTLENVSTQSQPLQAWVMASATSDVPAGWSQYEWGDGNQKPVELILHAGQSQTLSQRLYVGRKMPSGAYTSLSLMVSPQGAPQKTLIWGDFPTVLFSDADGGMRAAAAPKATTLRRPAGSVRAGDGSAAPAAAGGTTIVGRVVAADTGLPLPVEYAPKLELMMCEQPDDNYCRWMQGDAARLDATGTFTVNFARSTAGRYQLHAVADSHYGATYSPTFDLPGEPSQLLQLKMQRFAVELDAVKRCTAAPSQACTMVYTLRNTTRRELRTRAWLYTYAVVSESQTGSSTYDIGRGGDAHSAPMLLNLAPGQSVELSQTIDFSGLPAGAAGWLRLFVSESADIADALASFAVGNYSVSAGTNGAVVSVVPRPDIIISNSPQPSAGR